MGRHFGYSDTLLTACSIERRKEIGNITEQNTQRLLERSIQAHNKIFGFRRSMESNGGGSMQDSEYFLQWGNRKRNRVPRNTTTTKTITRFVLLVLFLISKFLVDWITLFIYLIVEMIRKKKNNSTSTLRSNTYRKASSSSPDNNNDHHYTYTNRRGGGGVGVGSNNSKGKVGHYVWPKLHLGLSDKEKEDDFIAMKGCKPPQRPKKRPKAIQKSLLVSTH